MGVEKSPRAMTWQIMCWDILPGEERKVMDEAADRAVEAIHMILTEDIDKAMNHYNTKKHE